jgi:hypothetical protein
MVGGADSAQGAAVSKRPPAIPTAAGALLRDLFNRRGMEEKMREYRAWKIWGEVVGPQIAARARPTRIRDDILEVSVDHPIWMQQLHLLKPDLLARLNQRLGGEVFRDIFWKRGRITPHESIIAAPEPPPDWLQIPLSTEDRQQIAAIVAPLADDELRLRLEKILIRQRQVLRHGEGKGKG